MQNMTKDDNYYDNKVLSIDDLLQKLINLFLFVRKMWKVVIISTLIGITFGFSYTYLENPKYNAELNFALEEDKGGSAGGALGLASQFGFDFGSNSGLFAGANIIELMKSRFIVEKTLLSNVLINGVKITLADYFINTNRLKGDFNINKNKIFINIENRGTLSREQNIILSEIYNYLNEYCINIKQKDKKVSIVSIEIITTNEIFSKLFCELLAKQTSDYYIKIKSEKSKLNVDILQSQVDSIRRNLDYAIFGVVSTSDNIYNLNPSLIKKTAPTRRNQIDVQANTAVLTQLVANLEISKVTLRKETPLIQILDSPVFPLKKIKTNKISFIFINALIFPFLTILILILFEFTVKKIKKLTH